MNNYQIGMKFLYLIIVIPLIFPASIFADELPDLGDVSQATITPRQERQIGLQIMRQIRADPSYLNDAEIDSYLNNLGSRLISSSNEAKPDQSFEFLLYKILLSMHLLYQGIHGLQQRTYYRSAK